MEASKTGKQSSNKNNLNKRTIGVESSIDLMTNKAVKNKTKNTIIIQKSSVNQPYAIKSKNRDKQKIIESSFNDVVNKFKRLFDQKIKFIKDQTIPTTERLNFKNNKTNASDNKVESIGSNIDRKNPHKQGLSELMSNIQEKLNMHRKIKQKDNPSITVSESPSAVLLDYMYKNKKKSLKSKQKLRDTSKQKFKNISGNSGVVSTIKKIQKPNTFQSIEQPRCQQKQKRVKSKSKSKSKNKINTSKNKKIHQFFIGDKIKEQFSLRQNYRSGNLSQGKYKSRLKTFESETGQIKKEKYIKNRKKSHKQKKKESQKLKINNLDKIVEKQHKVRNKLSEKEKYPNSKSPISARVQKTQQQGIDKKVQERKYKLADKIMNRINNQIQFHHQQNHIVSSSSDKASQPQQLSDLLLDHEQILGVQSEKAKRRGQFDIIQGSVITYDIGNEGQLKFSRRIIDTDSEKQSQCLSKQNQDGNKRQLISDVEKLEECHIQCLAEYLVGFKDYISFLKRKRLIQQFQDNKQIICSNIESKMESNKTPSTFGRLEEGKVKKKTRKQKYKSQQGSQEQQQMGLNEKKNRKLEHVLRQQETKWLDLKANLQRIKNIIISKRQQQCGEQLDKIIRQAEYNHLMLKSMQIKDIGAAHNKDTQLQSSSQQKRISLSSNKQESIKNREQKQIKQYMNVEQKQYEHEEQIEEKSYKQQNSCSLLQSISQLQATVKAPIRTTPNQININININQTQIMIQSGTKKIVQNKIQPNRKQPIQYKNIPNKMDNANKMDIIRNSPHKNSNSIVKIINEVPIKDNFIYKISQNQNSHTIPDIQLSQSELQLKILINQCKQKQQKNEKIERNKFPLEKQKEVTKQTPTHEMLATIFGDKDYQSKQPIQNHLNADIYMHTANSNNNIYIDESQLNQPKCKTENVNNVSNASGSSIGTNGYKKTKLSYQQAPLQVSKLLRYDKHIAKQVQQKSKQINKKLLKADLDLSDFMSNHAQNSESNHQFEDSSLKSSRLGDGPQSLGRRTKILEELKSPKGYKPIGSTIPNNSSVGSYMIEKYNKKNNIKISLFSKDRKKDKNQFDESDNKTQNGSSKKIYKSEIIKINEEERVIDNYQIQGKGSKNIINKNNISIERTKNKNNHNLIIFKDKNINKLQPNPSSNMSNQPSYPNPISIIDQQEYFVISGNSPCQQGPMDSLAQQLKDSGSSKYKRRRIFQQQEIQLQKKQKHKQNKYQVYKQLFPWLKPTTESNDEQENSNLSKKLRSDQDTLLLQQLDFKKDEDLVPSPSPIGRQIQKSTFLTSQLAKKFKKAEQNEKQGNAVSKFVLTRPKYSYSQIQSYNLPAVIEDLVDQFIQQLFQQKTDKISFLKIGVRLIQHFNINNIDINVEETNQNKNKLSLIAYSYEKTQEKKYPKRTNIQRAIQQNKHLFEAQTLTNKEIEQFDEQEMEKQFQRCFENQKDKISNHIQADLDTRGDAPQYNIPIRQQQKICRQPQYIINLAAKLLDYIHDDSEKYIQFIRRLKRPLGVDSLTLLKLLRESDQVEQVEPITDSNRQSQQQIISNMNIPQTEDVVDAYYVISLETLVQFQIQSSYSNATSNQQFLNQALYDKINMILDTIRPFGTRGLPSINFMHKYRELDKQKGRNMINKKFEQDYKERFAKIGTFQQIRQYVIKQLSESLKIKLGLFSYDIESDRIIEYSFNKMVNQYILELEDQWRYFNEGEFQIKHTILLAIQDFIINQQIKQFYSLIGRRKSQVNL